MAARRLTCVCVPGQAGVLAVITTGSTVCGVGTLTSGTVRACRATVYAAACPPSSTAISVNRAAAAALFTEIAVDEGGHAAAYTVALQALTVPEVRVPTPQTVDPVVITASTPACPGTQTQVNLLDAMHGEAFAYAKYTAYALQAAGTDQTALATLFSGPAQVELREHFAGEAVLAGLVGTCLLYTSDA